MYISKLSYLDISIIVLYLLITIVVGVYYRAKNVNIIDYAIAKKQLSYPILLFSSLATIIGAGSTVGTISEIYKLGVIFIIPNFGYVLGSFLFAKFIAIKIDNRFNNNISASDIIKIFYGKNVSIVTAIIGFSYCTGIAGVQITALGHIFNSLLGMQYEMGVIIGGLIIVVYSCTGGFRSVAITDVIQFTLLIVVIPILASVMLNKTGGMTAILLQSESNKLSFFNQADYLNYIILFFALSMPTHHLNPSLIQRYLAAINPKDIQSIMYTYCFIKSALVFTLAIIALSGLIIYPNILPHHLLNIAIINLLPSVVKGLTIAGIFAVIMSTADSNINSAAILLSHNCIFKIHSSFNELKLAKIATFISGIIGISIGLLNLNIIRVIMDLELIWGIMVGIPMIIGILRLSRPLNFFWYCCVITCITMFLNYYLKVEICISTLIVSLLISLMILVYNLWCNSGFRLRLNKNITSKKQHIIKSQYNITQFIHFIKNRMEENSINVKVYGTFCCINYIVPWFMWDSDKVDNFNVILALRFIAGFICVILLTHDYWHKKYIKYFPLYWYFTLIYTLPLFTTFMVLNNPTSQFWLINISLAIFLLAMLVDWLSFCIISFIGIILGITLHYVIIPHSIQAVHCEVMYNFIYIVIYSTTIGFIFNKRKELVSTVRFNTAKNIAGTMMHEIKSPLLTLALINNNIKRKINNQDDIGTLKKILPRIDQVITETEYLVDNILAKLKKDSNDIKLELLSIKHEINVIIDSYPFMKDEQNKVILSINYNFSFLGDSSLFKHVIHNLLKNSLYYTRSNSNAKIYITSERINEYNYLFFKDTGEGIKQEDLGNIFIPFYTRRANGTGLGLSFCREIMHSFGGDISCISEEGQYTEFQLNFPNYNNT